MAIPILGSQEYAATMRMFQQMIEMENRTCEALAKEQATIRNPCNSNDDTVVSSSSSVINSWRERVVQWFYDLIDHLGENRELTFIAMNVLDRYTGCCSSSNERLYELQAMSALFLAVRIGGTGNLALSQLVSMSRQPSIQEKDIMAMGKLMIASLMWDQRLLTPADFVRFFVDEMARSTSMTQELHGALMDSSMYLVELAVFDLSLARKRPSNVAAAAVMAATNRLQACHHPEAKADLASSVRYLTSSKFGDLSPLQRRLELLSRQVPDETSDRPHIILDEHEEDKASVYSSTVLPLLPMVSDSDLTTL